MQIVIFRRYRLEPGSLQEGFSRYVLERDLFLAKLDAAHLFWRGASAPPPRSGLILNFFPEF